MSEMKLIMENWRASRKRFLSEGRIENYIRSQNIETYGDLVDFMKEIQSGARGKEGLKAIADWASDAAGKGLVMHMINTYVRKKPPKPQDILKLFKVDPELAAIVDNNVETAFVQHFMKVVDSAPEFRNYRLDEPGGFDMNSMLKKWLATTYKGRSVVLPGDVPRRRGSGS